MVKNLLLPKEPLSAMEDGCDPSETEVPTDVLNFLYQ